MDESEIELYNIIWSDCEDIEIDYENYINDIESFFRDDFEEQEPEIMLTGKAKTQFERWKFMNSHTYIYALPESFLIALILEWFRNDVYFHLQIYPYGNKVNWCYNITDWKNDPDLWFYDRLSSLKLREDRENDMYSSYEEAAKEAIIKANEIYNQKQL